MPELHRAGVQGRVQEGEEMLTHFSLCTGIGGIDLAAERAGFQTVGQCEIDEYASKVLAKNFKGVPNLHDIRTVTVERLRENGIEPGEITVLSVGFPCQPYSLAGKGLGDGDERDLWGEVARCIGELKPKWFVGENTPGLFARAGQKYFRRILADLAALGYRMSWGIWGACDVGAPHKRDRVFIVCRDADVHRNEKVGEISSRKNPKFTGIRREISDAALERCDKGAIQLGERWKAEPDVGRVVDGVPKKLYGGGLSEQIGSEESSTTSCKNDKMRNMRCDNQVESSSCKLRKIHRCDRAVFKMSCATSRTFYKRKAKNGETCCLRKIFLSDTFKKRSIVVRRGLPKFLFENLCDETLAWWEVEPNIPRVTEKTKNRVDRLRCLGNAVVPQQAYPIFKAIADYEQGR